ncbi:MAG: DNA-directed RNA polymerase subunit beta' [Anaerolineae bacterium]
MDIKDFGAIRISLASPKEIRSWSHGEVTKPETINYRRLRPEKDGLFCEAIFGPTRDWQCYCGKYKKIRYRGIVCDKCGVEVTRSRVRRERMGHIELASPVAHIWYTRRVPSYMGLLLNISRRDLDRVLYFAQYIITRVDEEARQRTLKRIDDEIEEKIAELTATIDEQTGGITSGLEESLASRKAEVDTRTGELQKELETQTNEVMGVAARLQKDMEKRRNGTIRKPIVFEPTGTLIVDKGETIGNDHFQRLSDVVSERLSEVQAEFEAQQARELALFEQERTHLQEEANGLIDKTRREVDQQIDGLRREYGERKEAVKEIAPLQLLNEAEYWELKEKWGSTFEAGMGAEALYEIVKDLDLDKLAKELRHQLRHDTSKQRRKKARKRLQVVEAFRRSNNRPDWLVLTVLPVIPPDLRPMVQLDGGRFATSDLNDLYRRVINRNNRLKRLLELGAPDVIIRNEKRMLQESVDSLIDNSRRGKAVSSRGRRKLKSLSDMLKGKQGRFRRNLLGKRVDYSGRSVIVVGPHLKLHQCGLPKTMALELFRPFVMRKLVEYEHAHNVKGAKRLIERMDPIVWEVLGEIIEGYPVLLNRAPTLHRLGIQAFEPVLVEGKAIQIHPLVCSAFNADFDGDMMAIHIPLSRAAKEESRRLMLSSKNLLKPASGEPIVDPNKDMVLGCYYLTLEKEGAKGEGKVFGNLDEVELAYSLGHADLHAHIKLYTKTHYTIAGRPYADGRPRPREIETTVGRALFNQILPEELQFWDPGVPLAKGQLKDLVAEAYNKLGLETTAELVDRIKAIGFRYATKSGVTIAIEDIAIPEAKASILEQAETSVDAIERQYLRGLITEEERYVNTVEQWTRATDEITRAVAEGIPLDSPVRTMAVSGATKGGFGPIRQLAGMRGLMSDPSGRIIDLPITSNFREGLTALEYFISTHGARKGLADTALRTADAGYLTRRLVDVAQDAIINALDCETKGGIWMQPREDGEGAAKSLHDRILGRVAQGPIAHPQTGEIIVESGELITRRAAGEIAEAGIKEVYVRSALACQMRHGVCAKCYGVDLGRGGLVEIGEATGIIAAQSIGEPGTQLTLRTFHTGGVAEGEDITHGLPRVQELFEARIPKGEAIISDVSGIASLIRDEEGLLTIRISDIQYRDEKHALKRGGYQLLVEDGQEIEPGAVLQRLERGGAVLGELVSEYGGRVILKDDQIIVRRTERQEFEYPVPASGRLRISDGDEVKAGDQLTEGSKNPNRILAIQGREACQEYLLDEIQRVYRSQGVSINDKHVEMIIRQMLSKVRVRTAGDTELLPGDLVDRLAFEGINARTVGDGGVPATASPILLGITKAALKTESFLSAASFQHTITVLAEAAIEGKVDALYGLKENVIIGKLIPAGTGFSDQRSLVMADALPLGVEPAAQEQIAALYAGFSSTDDLLEPDMYRDGEEDEDEDELVDAIDAIAAGA